MGVILNGKALSDEILSEVAIEVESLKKRDIFPKLCVILVGDNPASLSYVNMKHRACEKTGIESQILKFGEDMSQNALLSEIERLNNDKSVSGILVQLPLPKHISTDAVLEAIEPKKDVDGFHPYNIGRLVAQSMKNSSLGAGNSVLGMQFRTCGNFRTSTDSSLVESPKISTNTKATPQSLPLRFCDSQNLGGNSVKNAESTLDSANQTKFPKSTQDARINKLQTQDSAPILAPATPLGVMELLKSYNIEVSGKNVAIIGASNIVGKPLSALMLNAGATISVCHILTKDISTFTKSADIVCVGVGKANLITADKIKDGAIVIDIGINKVNGKIVGDVDFENVAKKASFITPVPGGAGPMTIAMLLKNTLLCARANSPCGDFSGSASVRFVNEPQSSISSLTSHNPKNSSTMLEFAESNAKSPAQKDAQ